jgi:rhodanese-related sulfurtransferase
MKNKAKMVLLFLALGIAGAAPDTTCFIDAEPIEFQRYKDSYINELIFDVRPGDLFKNKILLDAINVASIDKLHSIADTLDRYTPILVYCTIGVRSVKVCTLLCEKGFNLVVNLNGGIEEWKKQDFKTVKLKKGEPLKE